MANLDELAEGLAGFSPILRWALERRGLTDAEAVRAFLDPAFYTPASPYDFPDMLAAVERVQRALAGGETILVWGDFDVDGQTSTSLLVGSLLALGGQVRYHIPVRAQEGHGIQPNVLAQELAAAPRPALLLTCDTGIGAFDALDLAAAQGVDVIITDHHELPPPDAQARPLPVALAAITPRRLDGAHPLAGLPGVGAAYKLIEAVCAAFDRPDIAIAQLDLVALGIVADVAAQTGDTRYLLQLGLQALRRTPRIGLQAVFALAGVNPLHLDEQTIGFVLGPRLNALGRLGDANPAVELLTTTDPARAEILAAELESVNARRRLLTRQTMQSAAALLRRQPELLDQAALTLHHPEWEAGVIGIVAGRLAELHRRPAALMTGGVAPGDLVRGSIRAGGPIDVTAALRQCAELLVGFGGHAAAAGFSLSPENLPAFRQAFSQAVARQAAAMDDLPAAEDNAYTLATFSDAQRDLAEELNQLSPFGAGNPAPGLRVEGARLLSRSVVGKTQDHLALDVQDASGGSARVMWWGGADLIDAVQDILSAPFDITFTLRPSPERGAQAILLEYQRLQPARLPAPAPIRQRQLIDLRQAAQPLPQVVTLWRQSLAQPGPPAVMVFAEGAAPQRLQETVAEWRAAPHPLRTRLDLQTCHTLVVWSLPPGAPEWEAMLAVAQPERLVPVGVEAPWSTPGPFLTRLAGMAKFAIAQRSGMLGLPRMAVALAQRPLTVQRGLEWLAASGYIQLWQTDGEWVAAPGDLSNAQPERAARLHSLVAALLQETAAFRRAWKERMEF